jgi:predicted DNA-binding protein
MTTAAISVRLNEEEARIVNNYAELMGKPVSNLLKEALLEKIEDMLDLKALNEALEQSDGQTVSRTEMLKKYGDI